MSWDETTLGDHIDVISGPAFKSAQFTENKDDVPLIKGENIAQGYIAWNKSRYWPRNELNEHRKYWLEPGDLVLAMDRPWIPAGLKWAEIQGHDPLCLLVQRVARIRARGELHQRFLKYLIASKGFSDYIQNIMYGVNVPHISGKQIKAFPFLLPDLPTQERIAAILSAYDDLIENNRRRIALLEQAARLLYREWFVHFRFPGHETAKFVDGLPEGWRMRALSELAQITMGQSPKSEFYNNVGDGLPFHQGVTHYGFRFVEDKMFSTAITKFANASDILFSVRAPVGRINYTLNNMVLGRGLSAFRSLSGHQSFLFYCLKSHFFKENLIGGGAIFAATNKKELESLEVICPSEALVALFDEKASMIDAQIKALSLKNRQLTKARDLLLPRLMDGRIPVKV